MELNEFKKIALEQLAEKLNAEKLKIEVKINSARIEQIGVHTLFYVAVEVDNLILVGVGYSINECIESCIKSGENYHKSGVEHINLEE